MGIGDELKVGSTVAQGAQGGKMTHRTVHCTVANVDILRREIACSAVV